MKTVFKSLTIFAFVMLTANLTAFARNPIATETIQCESSGFHYQECTASGNILSATVNYQLSAASCWGEMSAPTFASEQSSHSFGFYGNRLWVYRGCRAMFAVTYELPVVIIPPTPPMQNYCSANSVDGLVEFSIVQRDYSSAHIQVNAPKAYTWVMLANNGQVVANPYNVYCENYETGNCHWTFVVPNYASGQVSFIINAVNDQWWVGQNIATCQMY